MDILLGLFLILAIGCVVYSIFAFRRNEKSRTYKDGWVFRKEDDHLYMSYKNVTFTGHCEYGGDGDGLNRRFVVKIIHLHLKGHPSELNGWSKNDLYSIEQRLFTEFPEADIVWDKPMVTLINEEK